MSKPYMTLEVILNNGTNIPRDLKWRGSVAPGGYIRAGRFQMGILTAVFTGSLKGLGGHKRIVCNSEKEYERVLSYIEKFDRWLSGGEFDPEWVEKYRIQEEEYKKKNEELKKRFSKIRYT